MQTVITITVKDRTRRAEVATQIHDIASRMAERIEEGPSGTFRFTDYASAGKPNQPVTVSHSLFKKIPGVKIQNVEA